MNEAHNTVGGEVRRTTGLIILIISLVGALLFAISVALGETHHFLKEFSRELGVVLLTVCGVSMIYELFVAEKHFHQFFSVLRGQLERGETNAAVCEALGVREIFPSRDLYERKYPLTVRLSGVAAGGTLRIIARTLNLLMSKPEPIRQAIARGARVEMCFFDPDVDSPTLRDISELEQFETIAALRSFNKNFVKWLQEKSPSGSIEIRYHQVQLFDSFFSFPIQGEQLAVWDLSFGRDITAKRIFLVDVSKGLGADLHWRYDLVWEQAVKKFEYADQQILLDELPH
jgi:hypothetical protein